MRGETNIISQEEFVVRDVTGARSSRRQFCNRVGDDEKKKLNYYFYLHKKNWRKQIMKRRPTLSLRGQKIKTKRGVFFFRCWSL